MVDAVTIFPDVRATAFLRAVQPDIYVKGGDYTVGIARSGGGRGPARVRREDRDRPARAGQIDHEPRAEDGGEEAARKS